MIVKFNSILFCYYFFTVGNFFLDSLMRAALKTTESHEVIHIKRKGDYNRYVKKLASTYIIQEKWLKHHLYDDL
jgi:hypothetical protein